jgi:asparagine synthase (glutamine-hydrolysing)
MVWRVVGVVGVKDRAIARPLGEIVHLMRGRNEPPLVVGQPKQDSILAFVIAEGRKPVVDVYRAQNHALVAVDGEIFNTRELAASLTLNADEFWARPAALIAALIARHGVDALKSVDAAAAIFYWNAQKGELVIARDRAGQVPHFYAEHDGHLYFSNDLTALLALGVSRKIDLRALDSFLARGVIPPPWTMFEAIKKIPAAHTLTLRPGRQPFLARYALPAMRSPVEALPRREERVAEIQHLLGSAVERRVSKLGKTGVILSGGVSSSLLLATAAQTANASVASFTFDCGHSNQSVAHAEAAAHHFGVHNTLVSCSPRDIAMHLAQMTVVQGEPVSTDLNGFLFSKLRDAGVDTILDSIEGMTRDLGASARLALAFRQMSKPVQIAAQAADRAFNGLKLPLSDEMKATLWSTQLALPSQLAPTHMGDAERLKLYANAEELIPIQQEALEQLRSVALDFGGYAPVDEARLLTGHLVDAETRLSKDAAWSRGCGLPLRAPYIDAQLQDYIFRVSPEGEGGSLLRDCAAKALPPDLAAAPEPPRAMPVGDWLKGPLKDFLRHHIRALKAEGLFRAERLDFLADQHARGSHDYGVQLWALVAFSIWQTAVLRAPHTVEVSVCTDLEAVE